MLLCALLASVCILVARTRFGSCCQEDRIHYCDLLHNQCEDQGGEVVFFFYVGDAGNTSLVDAGTPLGATAVVTPGSACWLSTLGVLHPGVPVMWCDHIRDLFPTAGGCMVSRLPNATMLHWAQQRYATVRSDDQCFGLC